MFEYLFQSSVFITPSLAFYLYPLTEPSHSFPFTSLFPSLAPAYSSTEPSSKTNAGSGLRLSFISSLCVSASSLHPRGLRRLRILFNHRAAENEITRVWVRVFDPIGPFRGSYSSARLIQVNRKDIAGLKPRMRTLIKV